MGSQLKNVNYRKARLEDSPSIQSFQIAMALETEKMKLEEATVAAGVSEVFKNPHRGQYFIGEKDTNVIACFLVLPEWSDWRNGEIWWIHSLYVQPEFRGQGVYRGLYQHLKNVAVEAKQVGQNIRGFRLYVDKTNTAAQGVYRKLGMTDEHYLLFESML
jgi:ribosomal protein S18 acetylase RimI-like enzyme